MFTTQIFSMRVIRVVVALAIALTSTGIGSVQAQLVQPSITNQTDKLEATLDESVKLDAFHAVDPFIVHFNAEMDAESSPNPLLSYPYIEGNATWDTEKDTLTFKPNNSLQPGETYTFFIDPALSSTDGMVFESSPQWTVQVIRGAKILSVLPKAGLLSTRKPTLSVTFDRPMNRASTEKSLSIQPAVSYQLSWKDGQTFYIKFDELLQYGQQYTLLIAGGTAENAARDENGTPLGENYSWSYGLEAFSANVLPGKLPYTVQINFSHDLNTTTTGFPFAITPALTGQWKWQGSKTALFTADEPIPLGQVFSLDVTDKLINKEGEVPLDTTSFQFAAPPPISSFLPASEQSVGVIPIDFSPIQIEFTTEVDKASAEKAFRITPEVSGRFEWSKGKDSSFENVLSFYPSQLLQYDTQYTVQLDASLSNVKGDTLLLEPFHWSFFTTYNYFYGTFDGATFGAGTKVQVVDANGLRRIQFGAGEDHTITFEAYPYDLIDFAALYADYIHGNEVPFLNRSEKEPVATWQYAQVNPNYQETVIPADVPPGLYILNLRYGGRSYDRLFVALTENTIVTKRYGEDLFVWVANFKGENVPEAEIRVYSDRGEKIREGKTNENGIYRVSIPEGEVPILVSARTGQHNRDVAITGLSSSWQEYARGYWSRRSDPHKYLAYIYTDRPIYRPGQTVNFKAIVSHDKDLKYETPKAGTEVTVNVRDAKNNIVQTGKYSTNAFGSINGIFTIAAEAPLGDYKVETVIGDESSSQTFKVQDYRKPDFKVTLSPRDETQSNKYVNKDQFDLTVDTEYFFGEPVANATLTSKLYWLYPNYSYWWWDSSPEEMTYSWYASPSNSSNANLTTDENGQANISYTALFTEDYYFTDYDYWGSSLRYRTFALEVTADDGSNQPVSAAYIFNVYNSEQKITLDTQGYFKQANQPFTITINTQTVNDEPMPERELTLEVMPWDSDSYDFRTTTERYKVKTDQTGAAKQELKFSSGYYQLVLRGQDARGNSLEYKRWIRVLGAGQQWSTRYWEPITISADQDEYKPYQTARFAIESSINGPALLTFERGSVIHSKFITLTAPLTVVEAQVIPEDAPNVFVTVNAWASTKRPTNEEIEYYRTNIPDRQLWIASTELKVTAEAKKLQVDISTDKQIYAPGEEVTVNIDVMDSSGRPVLAEVSLAMVDEAIFSLSQDLAPNIFTAFYGPRDWSVATFSSMSPTRVILDGGGRGGGGGGLESGSPRSEFQDTAAWFPILKTDARGRATVTFALPDNITSWRLSAKAITMNHLVGQSHTNIETKKDLLLRPILPRILTTGDQAQITTMIHNYSNATQNVRVTLNARGLKISGNATQSVELKAQEVRAVGWAVIPEVLTEANITIDAVTEENLSDAVSLPLLIQPLVIKDVESTSGKFNGAITVPLSLPPDILPEVSTVTLKVSHTPASTILDGLEYLTGYPYGCVEQTMSRAMPNAVLGRAGAQLGIGGEDFRARTKPLIEASIQKLVGLQHYDGGWGWWYDDYSDAYQTAWVLHGLSNIRDAGYFIDPLVLRDGSDYLKNHLDDMDIRTRAYVLYTMALAGYGDLESSVALMDTSLTLLDPFSQAALALTLYQLDDKARAETLLGQLEKSVVRSDDMVYWPQPTDDGTYHRKTMSSTTRTTAMGLSAFMKIRGSSALTDAVANYLVNQRTGYGWGTTNETSFTILALTDFLAGQQEFSGSSDFTVELNGKAFHTDTLQPGNLFSSINVPIAQLQSGLNSLKLSTSATDPLYYDIVTSYSARKTATEAAGNISVTRRYLDPKTNKPLETITEGQLVEVELTVHMPEVASFVIVEDHLPGGLEALNEGLNSTTHDTLHYEYDYYEERFFWQDLGYNYKEIRGDRVSFFITELANGSKIFRYFARATVNGNFTALPAEAHAMYDDQIWGRSASHTVTISPKR